MIARDTQGRIFLRRSAVMIAVPVSRRRGAALRLASGSTSSGSSGPSRPFSITASSTKAVRDDCTARVAFSSPRIALTSSIRRHTTSATKQSSPLTRYTERTMGCPVRRFSTSRSFPRATEPSRLIRTCARTPRPEGGGVDVRAVAADDPAALEVADAVGHGLAREAELLGEVGGGAAAVPGERDDQAAVGGVERASRRREESRRHAMIIGSRS